MVLRKSLQRAGEELGLSAQDTAQAIGKSRTFFEQARAKSRIDRHTQRMIALVLRLHRSLSACQATSAFGPLATRKLVHLMGC
jgi:hypothetical protein